MTSKIYILKHNTGTTVKVGVTKDDPETRRKDYTRQYGLEGVTFGKSYDVPYSQSNIIEKEAHRRLKEFQLSNKALGGAREIFSCSSDVAEKAIKEAINAAPGIAAWRKKEAQKKKQEAAQKRLRKSIEQQE